MVDITEISAIVAAAIVFLATTIYFALKKPKKVSMAS